MNRGPWPARAVLIDLDGTLIDTAPDIAAAVNAMLVELGRTELPAGTVAAFVGKGADVLVHRALSAARPLRRRSAPRRAARRLFPSGSLDGRIEEALFANARDAFHRHYRRLNGVAAQLYPGITAALEAWLARGLKLACVTNKPREFTRTLLERAGLAPYFDAVISGDDASHKKPHAAPLIEACAKMGLPVADVVMIGDSENDLLAARAAGCPAILVEGGYNEGRPVAGLPADAIVPSLAAAVPMVVLRDGPSR